MHLIDQTASSLGNNNVHFPLHVDTGKNLSDLERLARQEKMYCVSQLKNGQAEARSTRPSKSPEAVKSNDVKPNKL